MTVTSTELVIVGAGSAGLAAMRAAIEQGIESLLLEASDRIGGRAWTESASLGIPWDRGCHWLHSADINPMRELADRYGFSYQREPSDWRLIEGGAPLDQAATDAVDSEIESVYAAGIAAGRGGDDRPMAEFDRVGGLASQIFTMSLQAE